MKPKLIITALAVLAFSIVKAQKPEPIPGQYIVVLKESAAMPVVKKQKKNNDREKKANDNKPERDKNLAKVKDVQKKKNIQSSSVLNEFADVLVGFSAKLTGTEKKALEEDPDVEAVYPDYSIFLPPTPNEANPSDLGYNPQHQHDEDLGNTRSGPSWNAADNTYVRNDEVFAQYVSCAITKAGGFADGTAKGTWIWILDTGIQLDHPDLNVLTSATYAKSFVPNQAVNDGHGHGTHVAGIAAAKNNTIGVVGVSAGARVVPVKVLPNSGSGQFSWLVSALNHVAIYDIPGDVINMSLGGYPISSCENNYPALRDIIRNLGNSGTWVVMAAGNDGNCTGATSNLPGCINGTRVITVGALNCDLTRAAYSNGGTNVDWVAVGSSVYSTCIGSSYCTKSGTSMASPVVAGIIHARGGAPANGGNINFCGTTKPLAKR